MLLPRGMRRWARSGQAALLDIVTRGQGIRRTLPNGESVRVHPACRNVSWNLAEYEAFQAAVCPGATVFDVGANVGAYSLLFGKWTKPGGKVYAFEPSPQTCARLMHHVRLNGLDDVIEVIPTAIADSCTKAAFTTAPPDGMHRLLSGPSTCDAVLVPVMTLDAFCAERGVRPDVVKIDVEGFELAVLRGARQTLKAVGRGLEVFMEIHPSLWAESGTSQSDLLDELNRQELRLEPLESGQPIWSIEGVCLRVQRSAA